MPVFTKIGENAVLLALLLEAPQGTLEIFVIVNDDFRQTAFLPGRRS
jgi:hypothetical protein